MLTDAIYRLMRSRKDLQRQFKRVLVRLPHRQRVVTRFGQRIYVDPSELHGFYLYYEREYDDHIFNFLGRNLSRYCRALDLGANIGVYTLFLAARVDRVDAFEPEPLVLEKLRANLVLNRVSNVVIHETCVGNVSGNIGFDPPVRSNEGIGRVSAGPLAASVRCCTTLNAFLGEEIRERCFIKMDVEGAEWLVFQAAHVLFRPKVPVAMLIEIHPEEIKRLGGSTAQLRSRLEEMGYAVHALTASGPQMLNDTDFRFWWVTSHDDYRFVGVGRTPLDAEPRSEERFRMSSIATTIVGDQTAASRLTPKQRLGAWLFPRMPITRFLFDQLRTELNCGKVGLQNSLIPSRRRTLRRIRQLDGIYANIACGPRSLRGFVNLDLHRLTPDIVQWDCRWDLPFNDRSVAGARVEHFLEHLEPREELPAFLKACLRVLRHGGVLRVIVPDAERYLRAYCRGDLSGFTELAVPVPFPADLPTPMDVVNHVFHQWHEHRWGYDFDTLAHRLRTAGFNRVERAHYQRSLDAALAEDCENHSPYSLYVDAVKL